MDAVKFVVHGIGSREQVHDSDEFLSDGQLCLVRWRAARVPVCQRLRPECLRAGVKRQRFGWVLLFTCETTHRFLAKSWEWSRPRRRAKRCGPTSNMHEKNTLHSLVGQLNVLSQSMAKSSAFCSSMPSQASNAVQSLSRPSEATRWRHSLSQQLGCARVCGDTEERGAGIPHHICYQRDPHSRVQRFRGPTK